MDGTTYNTSTVCTGDYMQCKYPTWIKQHPVSQFVCARFEGKKDGRDPETLGLCLVIFSCSGGGRRGVWISLGLVFGVHSRCTRVEGNVV
jgi:hypothetical protein